MESETMRTSDKLINIVLILKTNYQNGRGKKEQEGC